MYTRGVSVVDDGCSSIEGGENDLSCGGVCWNWW